MLKTKQKWKTRSLKTARLSDFAPLVSFTSAICGNTVVAPEPSIIVSCPAKILRRVEKELQSQHMKNQYAVGFTSGPTFTLYCCARKGPAFNLVWTTNRVSLNVPEQYLSLCGARMSPAQPIEVFPPPGEATVACLIGIDDKLYALDPAHLFARKDGIKSQEQLLAELLQMEDDDIAFDENDDDEENNEGNDRDNSQVPTNDTTLEQGTFNSNAIPLSTQHVLDTPNSKAEGLEDLVVIFPGPEDLKGDNTDGDWAVTLIEKPDRQLPNMYIPDSERGKQKPEPQHIVYSAVEPKMYGRVYILTSSSIKHGDLLPGLANISGLSGRGHCNVQIISMIKHNGE